MYKLLYLKAKKKSAHDNKQNYCSDVYFWLALECVCTCTLQIFFHNVLKKARASTIMADIFSVFF